MKTYLASVLLLFAALSSLALSPGDDVTVDAIGKASFLKGQAPSAWEDGKVYIIECWATWCGPCLAAIPHVDGLFDRYQGKGLRVIGMNVWDRDETTVRAFVDRKGDGMSYPVAFVAGEGAFETEWLKPAGVQGIPHAFVVKDGEFLFSTHPAALTEETVEALLKGGEEAEGAVKEVREKAAAGQAIEKLLLDFAEGYEADDVAKMETALAEIRRLDPEFSHLAPMAMHVAVTKQDWDAAARGMRGLEETQARWIAVRVAGALDGMQGTPPAGFLDLLHEAIGDAEGLDAIAMAAVARLRWRLGKKEEALAAAEKSVELSDRFPKEPFEAFAASFEEGKPQTLEELQTAMVEAFEAVSAGD